MSWRTSSIVEDGEVLGKGLRVFYALAECFDDAVGHAERLELVRQGELAIW